MRLKNEIFLAVLDWLHFNKNVRDQAHLAEIIGIDATSMSRIMNGRNEPSEKTLRKLNEAFGNIFNMDYLRGKVPYPMLAADIKPTNFTADIGTTGNLSASFFTVSSDDEWTTNLTVTAVNGNNVILGTASITAAPFIANRATAYSGNLFSNMNAFTISLNDTWLSDEVLTW